MDAAVAEFLAAAATLAGVVVAAVRKEAALALVAAGLFLFFAARFIT